MKNKLQSIKEDASTIASNVASDLRKEQTHVSTIADEYSRVTEYSHAPMVIINEIDEQFKKATSLTSVDILILFLATAIQCTRQYILSNEKYRITASEGDALMEKTIGKIVESVKPEWKDVLFQSVPYDAVQLGGHVNKTGLAGTTHRYRTLGHDPVLGWIFGTANIMTNALTKSDFITTYQISCMKIIGMYHLGTLGMFSCATDFAKEDPVLLAAALGRQAIHFGSDYFTKQGLPIPFMGSLAPEAIHTMMFPQKWNSHIDMWSITRGAALAAFINQLVAFFHRMFFDSDRDISESLYEVRTRKILSYSNIMATGSNILVTAFTQDAAKLDVGGMVVTIHRIVQDKRFIDKIKEDFLKNELYDRIVGTEYDFMKEDY